MGTLQSKHASAGTSGSPSPPVGCRISNSLVSGFAWKYALVTSLPFRLSFSEATQLAKRQCDSASAVGASHRTSSRLTSSKFPQITNRAFILGLYSGVPFKCSCLSVSTHFDGITLWPSSSRFWSSFPQMGIAALKLLYFSHSAVRASIIKALISGETFLVSTVLATFPGWTVSSASTTRCAMKDLSGFKSSSRSMARRRSNWSCALRKTVKPVQASVSSTFLVSFVFTSPFLKVFLTVANPESWNPSGKSPSIIVLYSFFLGSAWTLIATSLAIRQWSPSTSSASIVSPGSAPGVVGATLVYGADRSVLPVLSLACILVPGVPGALDGALLPWGASTSSSKIPIGLGNFSPFCSSSTWMYFCCWGPDTMASGSTGSPFKMEKAKASLSLADLTRDVLHKIGTPSCKSHKPLWGSWPITRDAALHVVPPCCASLL